MTILEEITALLNLLGFVVETVLFSGVAPPEYVVLTPMFDRFSMHGDDLPIYETQEVRISLFTQSNYIKRKNLMVKELLKAGFTVTGRHYVGLETDTGYHHYAVDAAKNYDYSID